MVGIDEALDVSNKRWADEIVLVVEVKRNRNVESIRTQGMMCRLVMIYVNKYYSQFSLFPQEVPLEYQYFSLNVHVHSVRFKVVTRLQVLYSYCFTTPCQRETRITILIAHTLPMIYHSLDDVYHTLFYQIGTNQ